MKSKPKVKSRFFVLDETKNQLLSMGPFPDRKAATAAADRFTISSPELIGKLVPVEVVG